MDKVLSTVLLVVAAVVCVTLVINAVVPAITSSTGSLGSAAARMGENKRSQVEIILATAELDEAGNWTDTDDDGYFDVFIWVKNVGTESVRDIERCDIFLDGNQTVWAWIPHLDYANNTFPQWDYEIVNGTVWSTAITLKIEIDYQSPLAIGEYHVRTLIPNGISDDYYFSM